MRSMYQRGGQLVLAKRFQDVELIDVSHAGIFRNQLDPARSFTRFLHKKIVDMCIAQSFHMDAFPFGGETVIRCFSLLQRLCLVNVKWNGADV